MKKSWNPFTDHISDEVARTWGGNITVNTTPFLYKKGIVFNNNTIFNDCTDLKHLKKKFFQISNILHPDKGGDVCSMQNLNSFYLTAKKNLSSCSTKTRSFKDTFDF